MGERIYVVEPGSDEQWFALIRSAHERSGHHFDDKIENYLMITVKKFLTDNQLVDHSIAMRLLTGLNDDQRNPNLLREVGDECLVISGLFPERAYKRNVSLTYYIHSGQQAYNAFATHQHTHCHDTELFLTLSEHFVGLLDVLHWVRMGAKDR